MKISFKNNFTWNFFGNILYAATQWGILISLTRLGNIEMVGIYSLALALTAPILMFTNLDLRIVQATETDENFKLSDFLTVRLLTNFLFIVLLILILILGNYSLFYTLAIILIAISKIIESWSDVIYGHFQRHERMDFIAKSQIYRGVGSLFVMVTTLFLTNSLLFSLIFMALCWLTIFILYDLRNVRGAERLKLSFSYKLSNIIKLALPLGIVALVISLNANIPRIVIERIMDVESLGYFTTIFYFVMIGEKVVRSLSQVALPRLSKLLSEQNKKKYWNVLLKVLSISILIGVLGIIVSFAVGEKILILVYGNNYEGYGVLLNIIMFYGLFNYINSTLLVGVNSMRLFSIQKYLSIFWLFAMILLCIPLINNFGLLGACISLVMYGLIRFITISILLLYGLKTKFI